MKKVSVYILDYSIGQLECFRNSKSFTITLALTI